jgi:hypothetical protein
MKVSLEFDLLLPADLKRYRLMKNARRNSDMIADIREYLEKKGDSASIDTINIMDDFIVCYEHEDEDEFI